MLSIILAATLTSTAELPAARDNTIYQENSDLSNGAGGDVFTGRTSSGSVRRGLLAFDLTAIPAGSVVQSAALHLTLTLAPTMDSRNVSLRRLTADWGEAGSIAPGPGGLGGTAELGDATWGERFYGSASWATAGGDFAVSASATTSVGFDVGTDYVWGSTSAMVADVQAWVDDTTANHGWILIGNELATMTARRFASRENSATRERPVLVVEYTAPAAGPGAVPDGGARPGTPLTLARSGSTLSLSWGASCRPAADYVVQRGTLGALRTGTYDDVPVTCTTGGQTSYTAAVPVADAYFLVLPLDGGATGSRGLTGAGAERPQGASGCGAPSIAPPVCP